MSLETIMLLVWIVMGLFAAIGFGSVLQKTTPASDQT